MSIKSPDILDWYAHLHFESWENHEYRTRIYPARHGRWLLHLLGGLDNMASKNGNGRGNFAQIEFVVINLDAAAEKAFTAYEEVNTLKLVPKLAEFIADGHKVGLSWDDSNNCFIASATCKQEKSENYNQCITARSDDWSQALLLVLYKAEVVAKNGTWANVSRPIAWG